MKFHNIFLCCLVFSSIIIISIQARLFTASSIQRLYTIIIKNPLSVIYFYQDSPDKENQEILQTVARITRFQEAEIAFVAVNTSKKSLAQARLRYHITTPHAFLILNRGEPYSLGPLTGHITRQKLENYINSAAQDEINGILADKAEARKQREQEKAAGFYGYGIYPVSWGCPYGYGGWPYWRAGFGVSFGC